jgi:hypothetical protein
VKQISNFDLTFELTKLYGLIQNVDDRTTDAVETNYMLRDLAYQIDCPLKIMQAYKLLGLSLQAEKKYLQAVVCFKMIMLYSW